MRMQNFFLAVMLGSLTATAQEPTTETAPTEQAATQNPAAEQPAATPEPAKPAAPSPMALAIEKTAFLTNKKPSVTARYYMYLASAKWCGPCRRVMPALLAEYPNMIADDSLDIIFLSCDRTPDDARKYMEQYKMPFAGVMYGSAEAAQLPGCPTDIRGIPHIIVVDAAGNLIYRGHGLRFVEWKAQIINAEQK